MMKNNRFCSAVLVLVISSFLSGCIVTGIRVGPVFIPVDTGLGKDKKPPKKEGSERPEHIECSVTEGEDNQSEDSQAPECEQDVLANEQDSEEQDIQF